MIRKQDALAELRSNPDPSIARLALMVETTNELTIEQAIAVARGDLDLDRGLDEHRARVAARQEGRERESLPPAFR